METAREVIVACGWTPQIKVRRKKKVEYLYACKRYGKKMVWRYIGKVSNVGAMTQEGIQARLPDKQTS